MTIIRSLLSVGKVPEADIRTLTKPAYLHSYNWKMLNKDVFNGHNKQVNASVMQSLFVYSCFTNVLFYPMYLSSLKSLDKYMASFDHKISNIDLSSQTVILMKCFINLPEYRVDFENIKCV